MGEPLVNLRIAQFLIVCGERINCGLKENLWRLELLAVSGRLRTTAS